MKIKTSKATNIQLNYLVAKTQGATNFRYDTVATYWVTMGGKDRALSGGWAQSFCPTTDWAQGGPIIERERIALTAWHGADRVTYWRADAFRSGTVRMYGDTPLIAAMRCYVASKLGDEVEIPEELT